jgi:uncharacterized protein YeaO (DUF488 family)
MIAKKPTATARLQVKRVYEPPAENDGLRVLVDRLWPRGLTKQKASVDLWLKDVAPSDTLRRRFHGNPGQWSAFVAAYGREMGQEPAKSAAATLREQIKHGRVTLLYASRDEEHNNAVALKDWLARKS